jgi:hypothetical protein
VTERHTRELKIARSNPDVSHLSILGNIYPKRINIEVAARMEKKYNLHDSIVAGSNLVNGSFGKIASLLDKKIPLRINWFLLR